MTAQLVTTVYVTDPDTHQTVELAPGTCPEARLAALVTNPAAWVDGKLPRLPKTAQQDQGQDPPGGQDDASGAASQASDDGNADKAAPAAKKTAARKSAAASRSRGRDAADEGSGGE